MSDATVLPTWAVWVVVVAVPVSSALGVLIGNLLAHREATATENRSKRDVTMQTLQWAAELAIDPEAKKAALGLKELHALDEAAMLDEEQQVFVTAALEAVVAEPQTEIDEAEESGVDVVVEIADGGGGGNVTWTGYAAGSAPDVGSVSTDDGEAGIHG